MQLTNMAYTEEEIKELIINRKEKISVICYTCGKVFDRYYVNALKNIKERGHIYCPSCQSKITNSKMDFDARTKKTKETAIKKYGSVEEMYKKRNETTKEVWLEKYGVEHAFQAESVKEKIKKTSLERYGVVNGGGSKEALAKMKNTWIERYGVDNPWKSEEVKKKIKDTNIKKYGAEYFTQTKEYQRKAKKRYTYNDMTFDSSWELAFYIFCVDNGKSVKRYIDGIPYKGHDGSSHMYYPDFEVDGKLYEIKGSQFFTDGEFDGGIYKTPSYANKVECIKANNVIVVTDVSKYLEYVYEKYGKHYLQSFRNE